MKRYLAVPVLAAVILACNLSTPTATEWPASITDTALPPAPSETAGVMPAPSETQGGQNPTEGTTAVWVYYTMAADVNMTPVPVARTVPTTDNTAVLVHSTLRELVKGPTEDEKNAGLISWFSQATAGTVIGVGAAGGEFDVDVTGWTTLIPNASTSAGSQMLLSQLNSTMFQFDFVYIVNYTLDGDCAAFWEWLQMGCHAVTRAEWEAG